MNIQSDPGVRPQETSNEGKEIVCVCVFPRLENPALASLIVRMVVPVVEGWGGGGAEVTLFKMRWLMSCKKNPNFWRSFQTFQTKLSNPKMRLVPLQSGKRLRLVPGQRWGRRGAPNPPPPAAGSHQIPVAVAP